MSSEQTSLLLVLEMPPPQIKIIHPPFFGDKSTGVQWEQDRHGRERARSSLTSQGIDTSIWALSLSRTLELTDEPTRTSVLQGHIFKRGSRRPSRWLQYEVAGQEYRFRPVSSAYLPEACFWAWSVCFLFLWAMKTKHGELCRGTCYCASKCLWVFPNNPDRFYFVWFPS